MASNMGIGSKKGRIQLAVVKESERKILSLQADLTLLVARYQATLQLLSVASPGPGFKRLSAQQELSRLHTEIRSLDKIMKAEIKKGTIMTRSVIKFSKEKVILPNGIVHPSSDMTKEEFLKGLMLVSHDQLRIQKSLQANQPFKVERRRRTGNPKYSTNGFVKVNDVGIRRSNRLTPSVKADDAVWFKKDIKLPADPSHVMMFPVCFVCYGEDYDLTCETCTSKFHANCIILTGSISPVPHRLPTCPKCSQASNTSQKERILDRSTRTPSIMENKSNLSDNREPIIPDFMNEKKAQPVPNRNVNPKSRRSNSTSEVEKHNPGKLSNTYRNFGSSKKQIEAVSPKAKVCNGGGGQTKAVRVARVRLNMRRSSDEPKTRSAATSTITAPPNTSTTASSFNIQPVTSRSELRWNNKLKPKPLRTYTRKRMTVPEIPGEIVPSLDIPSHKPSQLCVTIPNDGLGMQVGTSKSPADEEDEENSLLISDQSVVTGLCSTIKSEKINGSDQQSPLVIKNNNDVNVADHVYPNNQQNTMMASSPPQGKVLGTGNRHNKKRRQATITKRELEFSPTHLPPDCNGLVAVGNKFNEANGSNGGKKVKRGPRVLKTKLAKAQNATVIRKTIIAMSAAAATVMSNPLQETGEENEGDRWGNDPVMQTISSVIAWSASTDNGILPVSQSTPLPSKNIPDLSCYEQLLPSPCRSAMIKPEPQMEQLEETESEECEQEDYPQMRTPDNRDEQEDYPQMRTPDNRDEQEDYPQMRTPDNRGEQEDYPEMGMRTPDNRGEHEDYPEMGMRTPDNRGEHEDYSQMRTPENRVICIEGITFNEEQQAKLEEYSNNSMAGQCSDDDISARNSPVPFWLLPDHKLTTSELVAKMMLVDEERETPPKELNNKPVATKGAMPIKESKS